MEYQAYVWEVPYNNFTYKVFVDVNHKTLTYQGGMFKRSLFLQDIEAYYLFSYPHFHILVISYRHGTKVKKVRISSDPDFKHVIESILKFLQVNFPSRDLSHLNPEQARSSLEMKHPYKFAAMLVVSMVALLMIILAFIIHKNAPDVPLENLLILMLLIFVVLMAPVYLFLRNYFRSE